MGKTKVNKSYKEINEKIIDQNNISYIISFTDMKSDYLNKIYNTSILLPVGWINPLTAKGNKSIFIYSINYEMVDII